MTTVSCVLPRTLPDDLSRVPQSPQDIRRHQFIAAYWAKLAALRLLLDLLIAFMNLPFWGAIATTREIEVACDILHAIECILAAENQQPSPRALIQLITVMCRAHLQMIAIMEKYVILNTEVPDVVKKWIVAERRHFDKVRSHIASKTKSDGTGMRIPVSSMATFGVKIAPGSPLASKIAQTGLAPRNDDYAKYHKFLQMIGAGIRYVPGTALAPMPVLVPAPDSNLGLLKYVSCIAPTHREPCLKRSSDSDQREPASKMLRRD